MIYPSRISLRGLFTIGYSAAKNCISPGASIVSDDGAELSGLGKLGFKHDAVATHGDKMKMDSTLPMISVLTANLKTWIDGTFHGVIKKHLRVYLNELMFRCNRRLYRAVSNFLTIREAK